MLHFQTGNAIVTVSLSILACAFLLPTHIIIIFGSTWFYKRVRSSGLPIHLDSSTYWWSWDPNVAMILSRAAEYRMETMNPRTDPCGTPNVTVHAYVDLSESMSGIVVRFPKNVRGHPSNGCALTPYEVLGKQDSVIRDPQYQTPRSCREKQAP